MGGSLAGAEADRQPDRVACREVRRLTWPEMLDYWQEHARRFGDLDYRRDPDGLANVCGPGQPPWLSAYLARFQRRVFGELLARIGPPAPGSTALDVGTGAGRWARALADAGYRTTGIDLQTRLIEDDRVRFPGLQFHAVAVQDYHPEEPFDLVSSVTVLQHIPFDEQVAVVRRLRQVLRPAGHAVVLEHVVDQSPHVFSRAVDGWHAVFRDAGFELLAVRRYNYSPALHAYSAARRRVRPPSWASRPDEELRPEDLVARRPRAVGPGLRGVLRRGDRAVMRLAVAIDHVVEPRLVSRQPEHGLAAADCGFLFRAT
jgi:2-polyprenyl-3-methyl-5-hydroxy-6-metoxy-1,4-benzoquinol methylase